MTRGVLGSTPTEHGTARYRAGCRCAVCTRAVSRRLKAARLEFAETGEWHGIPRTATVRRLQALAVMGWSWTELGERLGVDRTAVSSLARYKGPILKATAARIQSLYDDLSMAQGPSTITRSRSLAKGWAPPLAWDDDTIDDPDALPNLGRRDDAHAATDVDDAVIERVLAGHPTPTNVAEREAIIPILAGRGFLDSDIAELVGVAPETVLRTRRRLGVQSPYYAQNKRAS